MIIFNIITKELHLVNQGDTKRHQIGSQRAHYNSAIAISPKALYFSNKGDALIQLNKYEEALASYSEALKLDPNNKQTESKVQELKIIKEVIFNVLFNQCKKSNQRAQQNQPNAYLFEEQKLNYDLENQQQTIQTILKFDQMKKISKQNNEEIFLQKLSIEQQNEISKQFIQKLVQNQTIDWNEKLNSLLSHHSEEICQYFKHILPYVLSINEAKELQIREFNQFQGGFSQLHFGQLNNLLNFVVLGIFQNKSVAIKEQHLEKNSPDSFFIALLREIAILSYCKHPSIAKIYGVEFNPLKLSVYTIHPKYYKNLDSVLFGKEIINIPNKHSICCQILEALKYLHSNDIIHMDLKPVNIVFESFSFTKIILLDFGISKICRMNQKTQLQGISYGYCPPEFQIDDKSEIAPQSDIFSFGIILYEFMTARPAQKNYQGALSNYQHNSQLKFFQYNNSTGNQQLDQLIEDCVQYDFSKRPTAEEALDRMKKIII